MIIKNHNDEASTFLQFSPYLVFCITYIFLYIYIIQTQRSAQIIANLLEGLPLFALLIATIQAFFSFKKNLTLDKKIEIFIAQLADSSMIYNIFFIIYLAVFNHMMAKTNGMVTIATLGLLYFPGKFLFPILFVIASFFSIIVASLPAATIILLPIGYSIALSLHANIGLTAATLISGTLCGHHLSDYIKTIDFDTKKSFKQWFYHLQEIIWQIIIPIIAMMILLFSHPCKTMSSNILIHLQKSLHLTNIATIIPYIFFIFIRYFAIDICVSLMGASFIALLIQIITTKILIFDAFLKIFDGFYNQSIIIKILLLHIMMTGLIKIIEYNDGFDWILEKIREKIDYASIHLSLKSLILTIFVHILTMIDKKPTSSIKISPQSVDKNMTSAMITSTIQTLIPYGSILFLTIHIYKCSYFDIVHYMIYPILTTIMICALSIHNKIGLQKS